MSMQDLKQLNQYKSDPESLKSSIIESDFKPAPMHVSIGAQSFSLGNSEER